MSCSAISRSSVLAFVVAAAGCTSDKPPANTPTKPTGMAGASGTGGASTGGKGGGGTGGAAGAGAPSMDLYVGCANPTGDIQHYRLSSGDAGLLPQPTVSAGSPVSNSALHPNRKLLYVNHRTEGKISTFAIDADGTLTAMGSVPVPFNLGQLPDAGPPDAGTGDGGVVPAPTNPSTQTLEVDSAGKFLLAPNYEAHTALVFGLDGKGTVGPLASWHSAGLRAHHTLITPNGRFVLVPYLGSHFIVSYAFDGATGTIKPQSMVTVPGTTPGPRHIALHSNGKWLYSVNETNGTLTLFQLDQATGALAAADSVSSIQPEYTGMLKNASEVIIHPSGKYLYVSNRLDNMVEGSLGAFAIDQASGKLTAVNFESSRGKTPRHFTLSPNGALLLAANQNSNNLAIFSTNPMTGALQFSAMREVCATPFFVRLMAP